MRATTIRFYNEGILISYKAEREEHTIQLRIPYSETQVYLSSAPSNGEG